MANNIFGESLITCGNKAITGYFRDGCCNTYQNDALHTKYIVAAEYFLQFSYDVVNDLYTTLTQFGLPAVKRGERWCLCAFSLKEALQNNCAQNKVIQLTNLIKYAYR